MGCIKRGPALTIIFGTIFWNVSQTTISLSLGDYYNDYTSTTPLESTIIRNAISIGVGNYFSQEEPKNCRRKCMHYNSKIHYSEPTDGGLDDRIRIVNAMVNFASFLCAELILQVSKG